MPLQPFTRRLILVSMVLAGLALFVSAARAGTYTETFSGPLNPNIWEVFTSGQGETVEVVNGKLVIKVPAVEPDQNLYAGIRSKFNHGRDFKAIVDYDLVTWPAWSHKASAGLVGAEGMQVFRCQVNEYWLGPHWFEVAWATFHGNYAYVKLAPEGLQGGMTGALLLTRDGIGARGQYNLGEGWRDIYDYSPQYGDDKFTLQVWAWGGGGGGQPVEVHFDNYQINGPNVHVSKSPLGALLLLD